MKIKRELKIGIFAVLSVFLFIWGLNYLKGKDIFTSQITFFAVYDDVTGLIESNPVSLNGVIIGQVNRIRFMPDKSGRIVVECIIERNVAIPENSVSLLTSPSLMGNREIFILFGDSNRFINSGDTLQSRVETSITEELTQLVKPIGQKTDQILAQIDSLMEQTLININRSFESINETIDNIKRLSANIAGSIENETARISTIMANAESVTNNLKDNNETLTNILNNVSGITDSLAAANFNNTLLKAEESLSSLSDIMSKINKGEGTMGMLVNDEELYNNLEASSKQLELLLEDIRNNPGKYLRISVFGR